MTKQNKLRLSIMVFFLLILIIFLKSINISELV